MPVFRLGMVEILDLTAFIVSLCFLGYSAFRDLKSREVEDRVWLIYGPIGFSITIARILYKPSLLGISSTSILLTSGLALTMSYLGLFGGADAKAFICIALANPVWPLWISPILGWMHPIFPLAVFFHAYLLTASIIIYAAMRNLLNHFRGGVLFEGFEDKPLTSKILAFLTGYKVDLDALRRGYLYPMEEFQGDERRLKIFFHAETDREEMLRRLEGRCNAYGVRRVWATPGLPLLVFALFSLLLTGVLGDILVNLIAMTIEGLL